MSCCRLVTLLVAESSFTVGGAAGAEGGDASQATAGLSAAAKVSTAGKTAGNQAGRRSHSDHAVLKDSVADAVAALPSGHGVQGRQSCGGRPSGRVPFAPPCLTLSLTFAPPCGKQRGCSSLRAMSTPFSCCKPCNFKLRLWCRRCGMHHS